MKKTIGICCPVLNEKENINIFYDKYSNIFKQKIKKYNVEFLFTDNNSSDGSFEIIRKLQKNKNVRGIKYSKNIGVMKSIYMGIINSPEHWDAVAVFDCDLQDPPELLVNFIQYWEKNYKIIYGIRNKRIEPYYITLLRLFYRKIENKIQNDIVKLESGAWLLDKRIIYELKKQNLFQPYLPGLIGSLGFKSIGLKYDRNERTKGKTKFNIRSYFAYAIDGIIGGSIVPLRLSIFVGFFFSVLSIFLALYFIYAKYYTSLDFQEGIAAMIVLMLLNFGLNFLFIGIIGEYIGRVFRSDFEKKQAIIEEKI